MDSSIFPRSRSLVKMPRAGGQLPRQMLAPASARALAMANPKPPSSETPATSARFPVRSIASMGWSSERESRECSASSFFAQHVERSSAHYIATVRQPYYDGEGDDAQGQASHRQEREREVSVEHEPRQGPGGRGRQDEGHNRCQQAEGEIFCQHHAENLAPRGSQSAEQRYSP